MNTPNKGRPAILPGSAAMDTRPPPELPPGAIREVLSSLDMPKDARTESLRTIAEKINLYDRLRTTNNIDELETAIQEDQYLRLATIPQGCSLVVINHGGSKATSIKHLNDNLLGAADTNELIRFRQTMVELLLARYGLTKNNNQNKVVSNYRMDVFFFDPNQEKTAKTPTSRLPPPPQGSQYPHADNDRVLLVPPVTLDQMSVLDYVIQEVEILVQTKLRELITAKKTVLEKSLSRASSYPGSLARTNNEKKIAALKDWLDKGSEKELTLSFGISNVIDSAPKDTTGFNDRLAADAESVVTARMHEQRRFNGKQATERREKCGTTYDLAGIIVDILRVKDALEEMPPELQAKYLDHGQEGWNMKDFVITALRKNEVEKVVPESTAVAILKAYYQNIDRFDIIRPWTDHTAWEKHIQEKSAAVGSNNLQELRRLALEHHKPTGDLSEAAFHAKATSSNHGYYIIFDDIGMGIRNRHSFERVFWQIIHELESTGLQLPREYSAIKKLLDTDTNVAAQVKSILRKATAHSGDEVTVAYYRKIAHIKKLLAKCLGQEPENLISDSHGGDEFRLFIPLTAVPKWSEGSVIHISDDPLLEALSQAQEETGMRAAVTYKNLAAGTKAAPCPPYGTELVEHEATLRVQERGLEQIKNIVEPHVPPNKPSRIFLAQTPNHAFAGIVRTENGIVVTDSTVLLQAAENIIGIDPNLAESLVKRIRRIPHTPTSP
ncbi:MAG: hypothetical protein HY817_04485 [Candidatus Abawacabacteria bacterium]|nr:hypothetical protein [Candidatus Abawacabacteria bacterium]